jgi:hypothetical protein
MMNRIEEIKTRASKADASICAVAVDPKKFRMSIPPLPEDTDELVATLCREDIPWLLDQLRIRDAELGIATGAMTKAYEADRHEALYPRGPGILKEALTAIKAKLGGVE